jgi:uncharacterized membrane protein YjgN (DUF898 family)
MPIRTISTPPALTDDPDEFNVEAAEWASSWTGATEDMNLLEANVVAKEASAVASATVATAAANFKGAWSSLAGALNIPASVSHNGALWMLLSNTANVALITPGVSAQWLAITPPASIGGLLYMRDNYGVL